MRMTRTFLGSALLFLDVWYSRCIFGTSGTSPPASSMLLWHVVGIVAHPSSASSGQNARLSPSPFRVPLFHVYIMLRRRC
ncbi:hypothetical protein C8Q76DRAFT_646795, partial [Earliella scabrosa]